MSLSKIECSKSSVLDWVQNSTIDRDPSSALSVVKHGISHFIENSQVLLSILDELTGIHPFIQAPVAVFKIVITLEITRKENDEKVQTLNSAMCEMMEALTLLRKVKSSDKSVERRLQSCMDKIHKSIKEWGRVCDSYRKRHPFYRFFTSHKWLSKFRTILEEFNERRNELSLNLQIRQHNDLADVKDMVSVINGNVEKLMEQVFDNTWTPEERELRAFVLSKGGMETVLKNDAILEDTFTRIESRYDKPKKLTRTPADTLRIEIARGVDQIVASNREFDLKFDEMKRKIEEVKETVKHESDRILSALEKMHSSGPHERIRDKDIHHVWREMGWKGSVKARHLVLALHDHFLEEGQKHESDDTSKSIRKKIAEGASYFVERVHLKYASPSSESESKDKWALKYLSVYRVHALIEAIDSDVSGFVTVAEVNDFTSRRPQSWSLPHWIAYWTIGFEMTNHWYFHRIRRLLAEMHIASSYILPTNRLVVSKFVQGPSMSFVGDLLAGLRDVDRFNDVDWDYDTLFGRFKDYVLEEEGKLEDTLSHVEYFVDDVNTLAMVTGINRVEIYLLPLLYLILRRTLWIIHQAKYKVLHKQELQHDVCSLKVIFKTVWDRAEELNSLISLKTSKTRETLKQYFHGMFHFIRETTTVNDVWMRTVATDASFADQHFDRYTARYSLSFASPGERARRETRREISYQGSIVCNVCNDMLKHTTRLICITCTPDDMNRVDFCTTDEIEKMHHAEGGMVHLPSHSVVQFRSIVLGVYLPSILKCAQAVLDEYHISPDRLSLCIVCAQAVTRPVWCCVTCRVYHRSPRLVCWDCNQEEEKDRPWLRETQSATENATHSWAHTLVLLSKPPVTEDAIMTVEQHISTLQTKLDEHKMLADERFERFAAKMRDKVERLEGLLTQRLTYSPPDHVRW